MIGLRELFWLSTTGLAVVFGALAGPFLGWYNGAFIAIAVGIGSAALWGAWWVWWQLPKRQVASLTLSDDKARADVEDNFRKTISQLLGGGAVLIGAAFAYLQFAQQQQASHDLLISSQVSKGFEQLGDDNAAVRLGGIYALEGVMNTSEQYHRPVLEALCAFVRDGTRNQKQIGDSPPATEIQVALTVIGRRHSPSPNEVDLAGAHTSQRRTSISPTLIEANLSGATLSGANLTATLSGADLSGAHLTGATLSGADLTGAKMGGADLSSYEMIGGYMFTLRANLTDANLTNANLNHANLPQAYLDRANLSGANLGLANLSDATLSGANLRGTDLTGADLSGANLIGATVSQTQLDVACGAEAKLPSGLTLKPCVSPK